MLARENFEGSHVCLRRAQSSGTSPVCLVSLVQPNNRDRPNRRDGPDRPNEQDRPANIFSILLWDDSGRTMDRRRLRAFLALFNVEGHVSAVTQFIERETLQRVFVKVHLAAAFLEDESVSLLRE